MARLIAVLASELEEWPETLDYFFCDPDGEVRGFPYIKYDFCPRTKVDDSDRGRVNNDDDIRVTRQEWEFARAALG